MSNRYTRTTTTSKKIIRAMFYVGSIGGLLTVFAGGLWVVWNSWVTSNVSSCQSLSYLEAVGLCSIAYVLYSGIRFAQIEECSETKATHSQPLPEKEPQFAQHHSHQQTPPTIQPPSSPLQSLSPEQRTMLLRELDRCCGKPYDCQEQQENTIAHNASK